MQPRPRQLYLDGIRGIAILSVLLWHYVSGPLGFEKVAPNGSMPIGLLAFAWAGVDVFFVLSGFLITDILFRARLSQNYFTVFFIRRTCRLLPLYVLALMSFFVARHLLITDPVIGRSLQNSGVPDFAMLFGLQNLWMAVKNTFGPGWLSVTWSLAAEAQFYIIWAVVIRYIPKKGVWFLVLAGLLAAPLVRCLLTPLWGYVTLLGRADAFLGGALVALILQSYLARRIFEGSSSTLLGLLTISLLGVALMLAYPEAFGAITPWYGTFTHSWILGTASLLILYMSLNETSFVTRLASHPALVNLGSISYGIYLFHQPIRFLSFYTITGTTPEISTLNGSLITFLAAILTILLSALLYLTIERGFISIGRRVEYHRMPSIEAQLGSLQRR